jgi:hypothetical protein
LPVLVTVEAREVGGPARVKGKGIIIDREFVVELVGANASGGRGKLFGELSKSFWKSGE